MNEFDIIDNYNCSFDYTYLNQVINHTLEKLGVCNASFSIVLIDDEEMHSDRKSVV